MFKIYIQYTCLHLNKKATITGVLNINYLPLAYIVYVLELGKRKNRNSNKHYENSIPGFNLCNKIREGLSPPTPKNYRTYILSILTTTK